MTTNSKIVTKYKIVAGENFGGFENALDRASAEGYEVHTVWLSGLCALMTKATYVEVEEP